MPYAQLGYCCSARTSALTDNTKFYGPWDEVYYKTLDRVWVLDNNWKPIDKAGQYELPSLQQPNVAVKTSCPYLVNTIS
jgi:hypothetical protein